MTWVLKTLQNLQSLSLDSPDEYRKLQMGLEIDCLPT